VRPPLEAVEFLVVHHHAFPFKQHELCPKVGDGLIRRHLEVGAIRL
jgi:hypothetical protein